MNTKMLIADKAKELFNTLGFNAVSLRDIAAHTGISYGNLTYHFPGKEKLVTHIFIRMMEDLRLISARFKPGEELLAQILAAPLLTFDISCQYLFLYRDYVEIRRQFPEIARTQQEVITARKASLKKIMLALKDDGIIRKKITEADIEYLMDLSGMVRSFFFMDLDVNELIPEHTAALRQKYVDHTNRILLPYLTSKGRKRYQDIAVDINS